jgi:hypothetical protein
LLFFPSYSLTLEEKKWGSFTEFSQLRPGELIKIAQPYSIKEMAMNGRILMKKPIFQYGKKNLRLGIIGLGFDRTIVLHGSMKKDFSFWPWRHPKDIYFYQEVTVQGLNKIDSAYSLRLPAQVWEQVDDQQAIENEKENMDTLLTQITRPTLQDCWQWPLQSSITSQFASPRRLPNGKTYYHTGIDLKAPLGTRIFAASSGRVVFSDSLTVPGETVIIDHGEGLFSRYMHLSQRLVNTSTQINTGDLIGLSGATGRVEGPHLHWEVIWQGLHANPQAFLRDWEPICDPK